MLRGGNKWTAPGNQGGHGQVDGSGEPRGQGQMNSVKEPRGQGYADGSREPRVWGQVDISYKLRKVVISRKLRGSSQVVNSGTLEYFTNVYNKVVIHIRNL